MEAKRKRDLAYLSALQSGDASVYGALLAAYRPLVDGMTDSFAETSHSDAEEVRAEAEFALYRAALSFDLSQDALSFGLYAKICIRNRLISKFSRKKDLTSTLSFEELYQSGLLDSLLADSRSTDAAETLADAESFQSLSRRIEEVLSPYEKRVFFLWAEDFSAKEIAVRLDRDEKSVTNAVTRSLSKLRQALS